MTTKPILGITIVLLFGAFCLLQSGTKVGDLITSTEAKNVWAGTCYEINANAPIDSVCSTNCGFSSMRPRIADASGSSAAGLPCKSAASCTYGGVGATSCSN